MRSWKARLLLMFSMGALILAVSVPAMAFHAEGAIEEMFGAEGPVSGVDGDPGGVSEPSDISVLPYYCPWPYALNTEGTSICSKQPLTIGEPSGASDNSTEEQGWSEEEGGW